jgi:gliding motility-associated-like protein
MKKTLTFLHTIFFFLRLFSRSVMAQIAFTALFFLTVQTAFSKPLVASTVRGQAYFDCNNNGLKEPAEIGFADLEVVLSGRTPLGEVVRRTTTADAAGLYVFSGVESGRYTVQFLFPRGSMALAFSPQNVGSNRTLDSDPNSAGITDTLVVDGIFDQNNVDAGIRDAVAPRISFTQPLIANLQNGDTLMVSCDNIPNMNASWVRAQDNTQRIFPTDYTDILTATGNCSRDGYIMLLRRSWETRDICGNTSRREIYLRVVDTTPPSIPNVPTDITVNLVTGGVIPSPATNLFGFDNCGENYLPVYFEQTEVLDTCGKTLVRTYTSYDLCRNRTVRTQRIRVVENPRCDIPSVGPVDTIRLRFSGVIPRDTCLTRWLGVNRNITNLRTCSPPQGIAVFPMGGSCIRMTPAVSTSVVDTICGVHCDIFGSNCQSFVIIIDFQGSLPPCNIIPTDAIVTGNVGNCDNRFNYCIGTDNEVALFTNTYRVTDNGALYSGTIEGCAFDSLFSYTYFVIPDQATNGPYRLDYWQINGVNRTIPSFNSIQTLVDSMNLWDTRGNWRLDTTLLSIVGGAASSRYGQMRVTQINGGAFAFLELNTGEISNGIGLNFLSGVHNVVFENRLSGCFDTLRLNIACDSTILSNRRPIAIDDTISTRRNVWVNFSLSTNDILNGGFSNLGLVSTPRHGSIRFNGPDQLVYAPNDNYCGRDTFEYRVCNNFFQCDTGLVFIEISCDTTGGNARPLAIDDRAATFQGGNVTLEVLRNDLLNGSLVQSVRLISPPTRGAAVVNDNRIIYTPLTSFCGGNDTLSYEICNATGCDTAQVVIFVACDTSGNRRLPIALPDVASTTRNTPLGIEVLRNDSLFGALTRLNLVRMPTRGTALVLANRINYQPENSFCGGNDTLSYEICNATGCDTADVVISVSCDTGGGILRAVIAVDDSIRTQRNTPIRFKPTANDTVRTRLLGLSLVSVPRHGSLGFDGDTLIYVPLNGYCGRDTFTYRICDTAFVCDEADVFIEIPCRDTSAIRPIVAVDDSVRAQKNTSLFINPTLNDTVRTRLLVLTLVTPPRHGSIGFRGLDTLIYLPNRDYCGRDTFTYAICDTLFRCDTADIYVDVRCDTVITTPLPPVAVNDNGRPRRNQPFRLPILANDTLNGALDTFTIIRQPRWGVATLGVDSFMTYRTDTCELDDTLVYRICNRVGCDTGFVFLRIVCDSVKPVANFDAANTRRKTPLVIGVLRNDTLNGADTFRIIGNPRSGTAIFTAARDIRYTPTDTSFCGRDTFVYEICNRFGCDTAVVYVQVVCDSLNLPPVTLNDTLTMLRDTEREIKVLDNDTTRGSFIPELVTLPKNGAAMVRVNFIQYTPNRLFFGRDSFQYRLCNNFGCDTAWVFIDVTQGDSLIVFQGFSPNGDRKNDRLIFLGIDNYPENDVTIYNRWGNEVLKKKGYSNFDAWDGTWQGQILPSGTYFYIINLNDARKQRFTGYIHIQQ